MDFSQECVPIQYRSVAGIARFTQAILPPQSSPPPSLVLVQNVTLPPHYQDNPGDTPKCRGYALVTLSTIEQRDALLDQWPWKRRVSGTSDDSEPSIPEIRETRKFGFRTISKTRWDQLNEEYVAYRQKLVDEAYQSNKREPVHRPDTSAYTPVEDEEPSAPCSTSSAPQTTSTSLYPYGCVVFVRNIHPETNKTTLKSLFSKSFAAAGQSSGLDYVDFNKGMDSVGLSTFLFSLKN